jgi:hypothetical protein
MQVEGRKMLSASTVSERLGQMTAAARAAIGKLLATHSSIHHEPTQTWGGSMEMTPWGPWHRGGGISIGYSVWKALSPEGMQAQASALEKYRAFAAIACLLLKEQPQKVLDLFKENQRVILAAIEQNSSPRGASPKDVLAEAIERLDGQLALVANLYDASDGIVVVVPRCPASDERVEEGKGFQVRSRASARIIPKELARSLEGSIRGGHDTRESGYAAGSGSRVCAGTGCHSGWSRPGISRSACGLCRSAAEIEQWSKCGGRGVDRGEESAPV